MQDDRQSKMQRLGDVTPELRRFYTVGKNDDVRPLTEQQVEESWSEEAAPETRGDRVWALTWVGVISAVALAAVVYLAVTRSEVAPPQQEPAAPAFYGSASEREAAAEKTLRDFHSAGSTAARLALILDPERLSGAVAEHYGRAGAERPAVAGIESTRYIVADGHRWCLAVFRDGAGTPRTAALKETPEGYRLDWEGMVAHGEMAWEEFCESRPAAPTQMRVYLAHTPYHNHKYSDPTEYVAFRVGPGGPSGWLYGYAARNSEPHLQLMGFVVPGTQQRANVRLRFEPDAGADNLVVIDEVIHSGWSPAETAAGAERSP